MGFSIKKTHFQNIIVVFILVLHHFRINRANESLPNRNENYVKFIKLIIILLILLTTTMNYIHCTRKVI